MFTLIRSLPARRLLMEQLPAFAISFLIAELFYKFHSFVLETIAFLITWFVIDALIQLVARLLQKVGRSRSVHTERAESDPSS